MNFSNTIIEKAKSTPQQTLVLPESMDERILGATVEIITQGICEKVQLIGDANEIHGKSKALGLSLSDRIEIINPADDIDREKFIADLVQLRSHRGMTEDKAAVAMADPLFYGAMLIKHTRASAMVAGAINATANVIRPAIWIVGMSEGNSVVSSCFVMESPDTQWGHDGLMIFSDCGIIPRPNAEELAAITIDSAQSCRTFLEVEPVVSLLSFSTKGSAEHAEVSKVRDALKLVQERAPELLVDGEIQMDAAIAPQVAKLKAPKSPTAGKSNTLIFPDLNAGNIAYKAAQRFGGMNAYGPITQGFAAPINDLSRGCNTQEVVIAAAITLCQSGT